jgi:hypothetical protein
MYQFIFGKPIFITAAFRANISLGPSHFRNVVPTVLFGFKEDQKLLKIFRIFF